MELNLKFQNENNCLKKYLFNIKSTKNDGMILRINHSYVNTFGEVRKCKFSFASFNDSGTYLAVADHRGVVYVIDLQMQKYWLLPNSGATTLISFPVSKREELLIGTNDGSVVFCHIETGRTSGTLNGHLNPPNEVSYTSDGYYCLTANAAEAIVWDMLSYTQIHKLSIKPDVFLKKVVFMPVTNHIFACFQDDSMHVWQLGNFECLKQIIPKNWTTPHLRDIAFTENGRVMVVGGYSPNLIVFCLDTWAIKKIVEFPGNISGVKQLEFVPQVFDGGANRILAILTTSQEIYFFDIETSNFLSGIDLLFGMTGGRITFSGSGKYLATILTTGEINVYAVEKIFSTSRSVLDNFHHDRKFFEGDKNSPLRCESDSNRKITKCRRRPINSIKTHLAKVLNVEKLLPILKQFGEYPERYRIVIWKTVLQLPENREAFMSLSNKLCHPSYGNIESKYPLVNKSVCNSLKKLLSNLSHWCPLFGEVDFLPEFAFPFVKLFHFDPLGCFEVIATIIVNWCQNWFEFYPFPPVNFLSAMEHILGHHDPDLLEFYVKNRVASNVTIFPLFQTAFSEVLSTSEWLKFWDHVISNEPSFLFMAIISYNVVCRNAIKNLPTNEDIEKFFHSQNPINFKSLISKTYLYLRETPAKIHCRQFFNCFQPLTEGVYQCFTAYPKLTIDSTVEKLRSIREEEGDILSEQIKALKIKRKLEKKLENDEKFEEREKICKELEDKMRQVVEDEEDRLLNQREKLRNLKRELRLKELEVLENTKNRALKAKQKKKELKLERLIHDVAKKKARDKTEMASTEEDLRRYYAELLYKKCRLELDFDMADTESSDDQNLESQRELLKADLNELQKEWNSIPNGEYADISRKIASAKKLIDDLKRELSRKTAEKMTGNLHTMELNKLRGKVKALELQVERLIADNLCCLHGKEEQNEESGPRHSHFPSSRVPNSVKEPTLKKITVTTSDGKTADERNLIRKVTIRKRKKEGGSEKAEKGNATEEGSGEERGKTSRANVGKPRSRFTCRRREEGEKPEETRNCRCDSKNEGKSNAKCKAEKGIEDYQFKSDSENEIFKLALKTRKDLIEEAKRKQKLYT